MNPERTPTYVRFFYRTQTTPPHRVPETNIPYSHRSERPNTRTSPTFVQTPQGQTSLSGFELNTNGLVEFTYSNPPLRRRLFSNEMESQNFEPIEMMRTEIKAMTKMMERMMGKIEEFTNRNRCKKCLRDTVPEPEINQNAYVTPLKKFKPSESDCSGNRKD